jgi:predicted AlkP superfamily pyrophosphatase or phosphodiesterase
MKVLLISLTLALSALHQACVSSNESSQKLKFPSTQCQLPKKRFNWSEKNPPKFIWLSIDSLNLSGLKEITSSLKQPHPKGFNWLMKAQNSNQSLTIREPTITASSHISTISCSTPEKHGIFANSQWNGKKMVSGFASPIRIETFATTLQKSGL